MDFLFTLTNIIGDVFIIFLCLLAIALPPENSFGLIILFGILCLLYSKAESKQLHVIKQNGNKYKLSETIKNFKKGDDIIIHNINPEIFYDSSIKTYTVNRNNNGTFTIIER